MNLTGSPDYGARIVYTGDPGRAARATSTRSSTWPSSPARRSAASASNRAATSCAAARTRPSTCRCRATSAWAATAVCSSGSTRSTRSTRWSINDRQPDSVQQPDRPDRPQLAVPAERPGRSDPAAAAQRRLRRGHRALGDADGQRLRALLVLTLTSGAGHVPPLRLSSAHFARASTGVDALFCLGQSSASSLRELGSSRMGYRPGRERVEGPLYHPAIAGRIPPCSHFCMQDFRFEVEMKALARHSAGAALLAAGLFISEMVPFAFQQPPATPQPVAPAPADPGRAGVAPAGRGGGRGNPAAGMYTERCAACHGTRGRRPRPESVRRPVDPRERRRGRSPRIIADGFPKTEMIPFKDTLTDQQIWQLVAYLRPRPRTLKAAPDLRAGSRRSGDQVREADLQDRSRGARDRNPLGPGVPPRRPPARHRTRRPAADRPKGKLLPRHRHRHAEGLGAAGRGLFDVEVHPQYAKNGWIYLSYAETVPATRRLRRRPSGGRAARGAGTADAAGRGPQTPTFRR